MAEKRKAPLRDRVGRPPKAPDHPLYRLFEERHIDKNAFAEAVGISWQHLNGILCGDRYPGRKLALKMSKLLGVPLEDILFPKVREQKEETDASLSSKQRARA